MQSLKGKITLFIVVVFIWLFAPAAAGADSNIVIKVSDPDARAGENYEGNTINSVLSTPTVTYGDNRIMGTLRITGKKDISVPLRPGNKVMLTLPLGLCYMQTPTADNYKNYVEWPQFLDGSKNQIQDVGNEAGVKFVSGTPRSIIVEINNIDSTGKVVIIDFVFNKENYSTTRVSRLLDAASEFENDPDGKITRLEFFEILADLTVPFTSCPLRPILNDDKTFNEYFSDIDMITPQEIKKIKPLVDSGVIVGYQGMLEPNNYITRAQAAHVVGELFHQYDQKPVFKDDLPVWATGINAAAAKGIVVGYPDGTFRPDQFIAKSEVLVLFQKVIESYEVN